MYRSHVILTRVKLNHVRLLRTTDEEPRGCVASHDNLGMSGLNRHFLLIGCTLGFGAVGFYIEEKVEAYYKVSWSFMRRHASIVPLVVTFNHEELTRLRRTRVAGGEVQTF